MPTLTIAHTKGGVGKSTTTVFLACAAHVRGIPVRVVDLDRQGTTTAWADAAASGGPLPFTVSTALLDDDPGVLTIVDTPPGEAKAIQAAIDAADLVVIPSRATPADLARVYPTVAATAHKPAVVVLTSIRLGTRLLEQARELLEADGVVTANTAIPQREAIAAAFGTVPTHYHGYGDLLDELLDTGLLEGSS